MTDTADLSTVVAELQAQVAKLTQTAEANTGGSYPHTGILAGQPPHTVLGPVDENGKVLPGAWNTETGHWEDADSAAAYQAKKQADAEAAIAEAKAQVQEANRQKAIAEAQRQLAEEADYSKQVEAEKERLRAGG